MNIQNFHKGFNKLRLKIYLICPLCCTNPHCKFLQKVTVLQGFQGNPAEISGKPPVGITGNPCNFVLIFSQILQGLQVSGDPCYMYMQVTG